jgi:hypothetical protein
MPSRRDFLSDSPQKLATFLNVPDPGVEERRRRLTWWPLAGAITRYAEATRSSCPWRSTTRTSYPGSRSRSVPGQYYGSWTWMTTACLSSATLTSCFRHVLGS